MKTYTLITGASSGLGYQFALLARAENRDLLLISNDEQRLKRAKDDISKTTKSSADILILSADLTKLKSFGKIESFIQKNNIIVDTLINNAGFGDYGPLASADSRRQLEMINLNIAILTGLTRLVLPGMIARKRGNILNMSSMAAFYPGPYMSVYYASKHFVLAFSEAIREELRDSSVNVTVFCPGPTNTGFATNAHATKNSLFAKRLPTAERVAFIGWRGMKNGKAIVLVGKRDRLSVFIARFLPRSLIRSIVGKTQR